MGEQNKTPRKRKLKKVNSRPDEVLIEEHPCITGGLMKNRTVLPLKRREGRSALLHVCTRTPWLRAVLTGSVTDLRGDKIISKVLEDIRHSIQEAEGGAGGSPGDPASNQQLEEEMQNLRERVAASGCGGGSSDGESGDPLDGSGNEGSGEEGRTPKRQAKRRVRHADLQVNVRGIAVILSGQGKQINLIYSAENLGNFVKLCQTYTESELDEHEGQRKKNKDNKGEESGGGGGWGSSCSGWDFYTCVTFAP